MTNKCCNVNKYTVTNNLTGEEVQDCFVLEPHDIDLMYEALHVYADFCWNTHTEVIARDLAEEMKK